VEASTARRRLAGLLYVTAVLVYVLDRVTKLWVEQTLAGRPPVDVIPGVLQIRYTQNPGGAFGLFGSLPLLFLLATGVAAVAIVVASRNVSMRSVAVGLGLILGGAVGNLTDRVVRGPGLSGSVVDFVDLQVWPVFNVADVAIVSGAGLVLLASARHERAEARSPEEPANGD
jgi:signal peptidase II